MANKQILFSPTVGNTSSGGSGAGSLELTIALDGVGHGADGITNFYYQWPATTGTDWSGVTITAWVYTAALSPSVSVSAYIGVGNGNGGNNVFEAPVPLVVGDGGASAWQPLTLVVPAYSPDASAWVPTMVNQVAVYFLPTAFPDGGVGDGLDGGVGSITVFLDDVVITPP